MSIEVESGFWGQESPPTVRGERREYVGMRVAARVGAGKERVTLCR